MLARKYSWIAGAGAAGFVGIVACGGGDAGSACGNYVDALNNLATKCGAKDFIDPSLRSGFVADCSALAKAPGASDLATQLNTCVDSLNASSCALSGLSCTIRGSLTDGSPCASGAQCTGGVCTVAQPSTTSDISCGTCASYGAVGATCSATTPCDPSTGSCVNQKCTAFVPQGGPCANGETCVNGSALRHGVEDVQAAADEGRRVHRLVPRSLQMRLATLRRRGRRGRSVPRRQRVSVVAHVRHEHAHVPNADARDRRPSVRLRQQRFRAVCNEPEMHEQRVPRARARGRGVHARTRRLRLVSLVRQRRLRAPRLHHLQQVTAASKPRA